MTGVDQLLSTELVWRLGWTLFHSIWQGALVAVVLAILLLAIPRQKANARYVVCCLALLAMLVLPAVTFCMVAAGSTAVDARSAVGNRMSVEGDALSAAPEVIATELSTLPPSAAEADPSDGPSFAIAPSVGGTRHWTDRAVGFMQPVLPWFVPAWMLGVFGLSLWHLGGWIAMHRLRSIRTGPVPDEVADLFNHLAERLRVSRPVRILQSFIVQTPVVIGYLRPVVLMPVSVLTGLSTKQLEAVLAHELAHVRRHDYLVNLLQTVAETLLFHHPAAWWISHRIRVEREYCCDDQTLSVTANRINYAQALAAIGELRAPRRLAAVAADGGSLLSRVQRILGLPFTLSSRRGNWLAGVVLLAACLVGTICLFGTSEQVEAGQPDGPAAPLKVPPPDAPENRQAVKATASQATTQWGPAVEGVQCRLRAEKTIWQTGQWPKFRADLRNQGERKLYRSGAPEYWEIELDGVWYRATVIYFGTYGMWSLFPGEEQTNILVPVGKALKWQSQEGKQPLAFKPGKHTVRFALRLSAADKGQPVSVVSNPVEITIERALPGSGLSIDKAVKDEAAFAAVCEAVEASAPAPWTTAPGASPWAEAVSPLEQVFKVVEVLFGEAEPVDRIPVDYEVYDKADRGERAIRKHERVIWIGHTRHMGFRGSLYGLKALPDTPENRQAVKAAAAKARPSVAESVRKPAAAWGEAVEGVQCRVRAEKRTWPQGALPKLLADLRNQGQRNLRIAIEHESWELEIDGTWHRTDTAYSGDRWYLPLGPGQQQQNLEVWIRADDNIGRRLRALEPGEHTLRVARLISSIRVVSNPVEITIERALPGSRLSIDEVVKEEAAFAAVCEAVARFVPTTAMIAPGGAGTVSQEYKVVEVLFGNAERVDRIDLVYKLGRAIRKHERVIWIGHTRNMGFHGSLYGLKALPDTPENRQAVKAAAAKTRPSVAESVRKPAAAWGEAVEGVQCRVRAEKRTWPQGALPKLLADLRNQGQRNLRIAIEHESWELEIDGTWYRTNVGFTGRRRYLPLGPGQQQNLEVWILTYDNIGRRLRALEPGEHTLRVTRLLNSSRGPGEEVLRLVSNPIKIEIVADASPTGSETTPWGKAVEGVRCRVRAERSSWPADEKPALEVDFQNQGERNLQLVLAPEWWELELDGVWYHVTAANLGGVRVLPFGPGSQQNGIPVPLEDRWGWRSKNEPLVFKPGKHAVRAALSVQPGRPGNGNSVRVVSNPVEITIERALPGSGLSIDEVVKAKAAFAAVCEAVEDKVPVRARTAPGVSPWAQVFKVVEVLFGEAKAVDRIPVDYKVCDKADCRERAIRKGERVIWIGHTRNMGFHGRLYGLKAVPDTPENRQAVTAAAAKTRPSVAESVRKAAAWGEAAEGLRCRVRCDQAAWSPGERLILRVDTLNTGDREMELYVRPHWCKVEFDGKWYHKHFTRYRHASFVEKKKLGKGGRHDGLEIPLADSWLASRGHDPMQLSPGKHTVRVRVSARPTDGAGPLWVSPISNAIEIDILPAESGKEATWGEAVEGVQCRVRAEKRTWPKGTAPKLLADLREQGRSNEGELFNLPNDRVPGAFIFVTPAHVQHLLLACREHR